MEGEMENKEKEGREGAHNSSFLIEGPILTWIREGRNIYLIGCGAQNWSFYWGVQPRSKTEGRKIDVIFHWED